MRILRTVVVIAALGALVSVPLAPRVGAQTPIVGATATPSPIGTVAPLTPGFVTTATPSPVGTVAPLPGTPVTAPLSSTQEQSLPLTATLIGAAEVPGPGDPDAVGSAGCV